MADDVFVSDTIVSSEFGNSTLYFSSLDIERSSRVSKLSISRPRLLEASHIAIRFPK